jgi:glycosyltransferase involved in cell wall biosynthesis
MFRPRAGSGAAAGLHDGRYRSATRQRRFSRALRLADAFVCGNDYLASFCRAAAKPVLVSPSPVPLDVPRAMPDAHSGPTRIGWIGAPHNLVELAPLAPALRDLARRHRFVVSVISEASLEMEGVEVEHVPWTLASQEAEIARLEVGVMPLVDSPWTRGKCSYKLLQYMAAGVPVVASPVGMNTQVVTHAENGLLADSPSDWTRALGALLEDPALARRLGAAGRRTVEQRYGYPPQVAAWRALLADLISN